MSSLQKNRLFPRSCQALKNCASTSQLCPPHLSEPKLFNYSCIFLEAWEVFPSFTVDHSRRLLVKKVTFTVPGYLFFSDKVIQKWPSFPFWVIAAACVSSTDLGKEPTARVEYRCPAKTGWDRTAIEKVLFFFPLFHQPDRRWRDSHFPLTTGCNCQA